MEQEDTSRQHDHRPIRVFSRSGSADSASLRRSCSSARTVYHLDIIGDLYADFGQIVMGSQPRPGAASDCSNHDPVVASVGDPGPRARDEASVGVPINNPLSLS